MVTLNISTLWAKAPSLALLPFHANFPSKKPVSQSKSCSFSDQRQNLSLADRERRRYVWKLTSGFYKRVNFVRLAFDIFLILTSLKGFNGFELVVFERRILVKEREVSVGQIVHKDYLKYSQKP